MIPIPGAAWRYGATFAAGLALAALVQSWRYDAQIAGMERIAEHERAESFRLVHAEQSRAIKAMSDADAKYSKEVSDATAKTEALLRCIESGSGCGLRIKTKPAPSVPGTGPYSGVGQGSGEYSELDPSLGSAYRALRIEIARKEAALKMCVAAHEAKKKPVE